MNRKQSVFTIFLATVIVIISCGVAGCVSKERARHTQNTKATHTIPATPTPTPIPPHLQTPTPTPDVNLQAKEEALQIANQHHVPEGYLKGEYALFLRFAEIIDENKNLNGYENTVYAIFPMIADHLSPENADHFFSRLASLSIVDLYVDMSIGAEYYMPDNRIVTNANYKNSSLLCLEGVLFHELVHFVDTNIDGSVEGARFCQNGIFPINDLENAITSGQDKIHSGSFLLEAGAELYTAKYFTKSTDSYPINVQFFTGIEHIIGQDKLDEIFFSHQTASDFANLLLDHGLEEDEIWRFYLTMDAISYSQALPQDPIRPEDVLIRLYTNIIGPNYLDDQVFCHILRCCYKETYNFSVIPSAYMQQLSSLQMTEEEMSQWMYSIFNQMRGIPSFDGISLFPMPGIYLDREYTLSSMITFVDDETEPKPFLSLLITYDFETQKVKAVSVYDIIQEHD